MYLLCGEVSEVQEVPQQVPKVVEQSTFPMVDALIRAEYLNAAKTRKLERPDPNGFR